MTHLQRLNQLMDDFLATNAVYVPGQAEETSGRLTLLSQEPEFMETALQWAVQYIGQRGKLEDVNQRGKMVLVTSLIKDKFKFDFEKLEVSRLSQYYQCMVEMCRTVKVTHVLGQCDSYAVYTNLALSLAYIFFNISSQSEQSLQQFMAPFVPNQPQSAYMFNYYYKILQFMAAEIDNNKLVLDQQRRSATRDRLVGAQREILMGLNTHTPQAWQVEQIDKNHIIQCFGEWVVLEYRAEVVNSLPHHFIMQQVFPFLSDARRTPQTNYCLKSIISHIESPQENRPFFDYIGQHVTEVVTLAQEMQEKDPEETDDLVKIVAQFGCKAVGSFIDHYNQHIQMLLNKLADFTGDEMSEAFSHLLEMWMDLAEELIKRKEAGRPVPVGIQGLVEIAYDAVCFRCRYDLELIKLLNSKAEHRIGDRSERGGAIYSRREQATAFFEKVAKLTGKEVYLKWVYGKIGAIASKQQTVMWSFLEVYLYSLVDAVKQMPTHTPEVDAVLNIYVELSSKQQISVPIILKKTMLRLYRSFMSMGQKDPTLLTKMFVLTASFFGDSLLINTAERTFEKGCQFNAALMTDKVVDFIQLLQNYPYRQGIVKGIIMVLCEDINLLSQYLEKILSHIYQSMINFNKENWKEKVRKKDFMHSLTGAMAVLKDSPKAAPCKPVVLNFIRRMWPFIKQTLTYPETRNQSQDENTQVQRMARFTKYTIRYLGEDFKQLIPDLYSSTLQAFRQRPICSYAYLIEVAITVYYDKPEYSEYFKGVYVSFCGILSEHINRMESIEKLSYLFEDFIGMNKIFYLYNASIVLNSGQLPSLIELCTQAFLGCKTPRIAKAAYAFLETVFMVYWPPHFIQAYNQQLKDAHQFTVKQEDAQLYMQLKVFLLEKLEVIITKMMEHLKRSPTESTRELIIEALESSIKAFPNQNPVFWQRILTQLPSDIMLSTEKERFCLNLQKMKGADAQASKSIMKFVHKYLKLINKRINTANRRKSGAFSA